MERTGQCHCGSLRVIATGEPDRVYLCHCKACQRRTGTAFHFGASFPKEQVRLDGERKVYERDADSGYSDSISFLPELRHHALLGRRPQPSGLRGCSRCVRHVGLFAAQRLDLGGVDAPTARAPGRDGSPRAGPTTDHKSNVTARWRDIGVPSPLSLQIPAALLRCR